MHVTYCKDLPILLTSLALSASTAKAAPVSLDIQSETNAQTGYKAAASFPAS